MVEKKASSRKNSNGSSLFTVEDDKKLVEGYQKYGNNWKDISREYFGGRFKTNQLFQRYKRVLVAKDKESTWSRNEDIELLSVYHHFEGSWVQMSKKYYRDTRTDNQLSNRWASLKKSCCLIDTYAKLKPNIKKDLYQMYKKVRRADGPDQIKKTNFTDITDLPDDSFPKIYLGEGRKVQKESTSKKRKTKSKETCVVEKTQKKRKIEEEEVEEDDSSSDEEEEEETVIASLPSIPRVIPTRGQRVNYTKMLNDEVDEDTENTDEEFVPQIVSFASTQVSEDMEEVDSDDEEIPQRNLSKQQVQWLQAQKCPAAKRSSSTAPNVHINFSCDEQLDLNSNETLVTTTLNSQTNLMEKTIQYTVVEDHDVNLNYNEEECLEIERFLGAPFSSFEPLEKNYSMEDMLSQTRIIKEYLEQSRIQSQPAQEPLSFNDDFCNSQNDLDLFDFTVFSKTTVKSPLLFDDEYYGFM